MISRQSGRPAKAAPVAGSGLATSASVVALEFHERRLINCNRAELVCANEMYVLLHPTSPVTWRAWDGSGFNLHMMSPYVTGQSVPVCAFLATNPSQGQVIYSSYLERYVYLAATGTNYEGRSACGLF